MTTHFFPNLPAFQHFIATLPLLERIADTAARGAAAKYIKHEIRERIGKPELLPPPLAESTQRERVRLGFSADETLLRTGKLRDSFGWNHESTRVTIIGSDSDIILFHEFGPHARMPMARTMQDHDELAFTLYAEALEHLFGARPAAVMTFAAATVAD